MPLRPPALDDRSFNDLVDELLARIPAHTPEWTSPTPGDPGRTLIELFAWMGDALLYRVNLIPERQRLAFLRLLGEQMRPAVPATGMVTVSVDEDSTRSATIGAFATVSGPPDFETLTELNILPVTAQAYYKRRLTKDEEQKHAALLSGLNNLYRRPGQKTTGYQTTPLFANGLAEPEPFKVKEQAVDGCIWFALLAAKPDPAKMDEVRATLLKGPQGEQQILNMGFVPALEISNLLGDIGPGGHINHEWSISIKTSPGDPPQYFTVDVYSDSTAGLRRQGVLRLLLPQNKNVGAPANDVRVDLLAGTGPRPPRIDDASIASRIITWLRFKPLDDLTVSWMGGNAVQVDQRQSFGGQIIGVSNGTADQQFSAGATSIDPTTFQLQVDEPGVGFQNWQQVDDLATASRDAKVYTLDTEAGTVRFGDGIRGAIPPTGFRIRVAQMRAGGGKAGNLPPGALGKISATDLAGAPVQKLKVFQPVATTGGDDSETLDSAERRIPGILRHRDRVVTESDYKTLAEQTPGVDVGRIEVLPLFKPQTRVSNVPGVVSVMALPRKESISLPNPRPDRPFLETIYAWLGERKPLATELYVIGCEYVGLGLSVGVEVLPEFGMDTVLQNVRQALKEILWPLSPGGHNKTGWPLGRAVRNSELEIVVANVPGVAAVNGINLFSHPTANQFRLIAAQNGRATLPLSAWQLPELLKVVAVSGSAPRSLAPDTTPTDGDGIAVPVVPEVC
jgi:Baseplate J-like protein